MTMKNIISMISAAPPEGFSDFISLYRKIEDELEPGSNATKEAVLRIAFFSSFTANGIKEILSIKCLQAGIMPLLYTGQYNQYAQEILDGAGGFYKFDPHLTILFVDSSSILGDLYYMPYAITEKERMRWAEERVSGLSSLFERIKAASRSRILAHNFEVPPYSPLGILENKQGFGFVESVRLLNRRLEETAREDPRLFIFDYDGFCSKAGKRNIRDEKMYYLGDVKLRWELMPELCDAYMAYIKPLASLTKKCIVLDLDNTLWGGIVGEDGFAGIRLGPTPEGRPFAEFQKCLLALFKKGVLLAINSRNNPDDAMKVIREHPHMVLKEGHFASIRINWDDKVSNMRAIAEEMNIGMDSIVFMDDDKVNRGLVRSALPEVTVIEMPEDPSLYVRTLSEINDFNAFQLTEEDKRRGELYASQRLREEFRVRSGAPEDYLRNLGTVVTVRRADPFTVPRIAQLSQRTNQFNMTSRRYLEEDIRSFAANGAFLVLSVDARDKFGDNGTVGAAIVEAGSGPWRIDTFLLSCRVLGRRIEETLLACLLAEAKARQVKKVIGEFIPTRKNLIAKDFYKKNNFNPVLQQDGKETWEYETARDYPFPEHVILVKDI